MAAAATTYRTITTKKDLAALVKEAKAAGRIGLHVENSDANGMRGLIVGIAIATAPGAAAYIPVGHNPELGDTEQLALDDVLDALRPLLESATLQKVTHNGHFDFLVLANNGVTMRGMRFDTLIASYLLGDSNMHDPEPGVRAARHAHPAC